MESTCPIEAEPALLREGRTVTSVGTKIPGGEFLVYYYAAPDSIRCDPDGNALSGGNEAGRLFHSLEDARAYAANKAKSSPKVGAGVYDDRWKILAQFPSEDSLRREGKDRQPGRLLLWSTALLFAGAMFLWWEIRSGWTAIVGFLIGSRLLLSGSLKFVEAIRVGNQRRKERADNRRREEFTRAAGKGI